MSLQSISHTTENRELLINTYTCTVVKKEMGHKGRSMGCIVAAAAGKKARLQLKQL